jgi:putative protease
MITPDKAEIMAPVGSYESLSAAINAGADSIYFGVTQLNMRARAAANFTLDDLQKIADTCHAHDVLAYLAVNTLLYDHDITIMKKIVDAAKAHDIDAVIAFDFATINYCNKIGVPVHMSVQFSISNYETVKFFASMTNRVVLARELTLDQITAIHEQIIAEQLMGNEGRLMEIEAFVHGALCVAQSGRCQMSLYTDNASANRGACRQNCRKKYKVTDMETGKELVIDNHYVMSAADICTIDFLDKLLDAGVQVMKIEGRGRGPEYVATVVSAYKQALIDIGNEAYTSEKIATYFDQLQTVFNRSLSHGNYYLGKEIGAYSNVYGSKATKEKEYVARVTHYYPKSGIMEAQMDSGSIAVGDDFLVIGATTGMMQCVAKEVYKDDVSVPNATKGDTITIRVPDRVRVNDKIYIWKDRQNFQKE